jgi:threonine aldolase
MARRTFASDNNSGAHPAMLVAIAEANEGHCHAYGEDPWTARGIRAVRAHLGEDAQVFFTFNGTGANVTALSALMHAGEAVLCPTSAHINSDECGAPERFTGGKVLALPVPDGKLTVAAMEPSVTGLTGVEHHVQPRVASISQVAETGVVYTFAEVRALADYCHANGMYLHMDGARVANAAVSLDAPIAAFTRDAGVDVLSLGGTKNGMLIGEAVVFLTPGLADGFKYVRKSSGQLASKMRYVGAQFAAMYGSSLWNELASHANSMAKRLEAGARSAGVEFAYPVDANELFPILPTTAVAPLQATCDFYEWDARGDGTTVARWVTSWDTTEQDIDVFCETLGRILG